MNYPLIFGVTNHWFGTITVCTAFEVLGCSYRTVMTRGAGTTPAWVVPGDWPGSVVPVASSVFSQHFRFSDFIGGHDSSGFFPDGGADKTKVLGVPHGIGALSPSSRGTGCTNPYLLFLGISACAIDGETKFLVTIPPPSCLGLLGVGSQAAAGLAVRGAVLRGGVEFRLTVSSDLGVGFAAVELSGCLKKTLSRVCGVSCFVYAMERGTERTTTGFGRGGDVDG